MEKKGKLHPSWGLAIKGIVGGHYIYGGITYKKKKNGGIKNK